MGRALVEQPDVRLARRAARAPRARGATCRSRARPTSSTTWPSPSLACRQRRSSSAISSSRPTSGVRPAVWRASKRSSARPSPATRHAASGSAKPLSRCGPRSSSSNTPPTSRRVACADHHRRRARPAPGAAPRGSAPRRPPPPRAPRPRRSGRRPPRCPVAMPTRAARVPSHAANLLRHRGGRRGVRYRLRPPRPARARRAPPARRRPRAPAASRNRRARRRPDTWRRGPRSGRSTSAQCRVVGAHHLAQVLGIEPRRQLGRADQVAEQHGQLPPLGLERSRRSDRLRSSRRRTTWSRAIASSSLRR